MLFFFKTFVEKVHLLKRNDCDVPGPHIRREGLTVLIRQIKPSRQSVNFHFKASSAQKCHFILYVVGVHAAKQ